MIVRTYDVICPGCNGVFHETNAAFRINRAANGSMFKAKQGVIDAGWEVFPPYDGTEYGDIACPACGMPYVDDLGFVRWLVETGSIEVLTPDEDVAAKMNALVAEYAPELFESAPEPVEPSVQELAAIEPEKKKRGRKPRVTNA